MRIIRKVKVFERIAAEGVRYFAASALALAIDFGTYVGLIRFVAVNYLVAAPVGFVLGLTTIYLLSVRWVFSERRFADRKAEFFLFVLIGFTGMALNQLILFAAVQWMAVSFELAKVISAGMIFCFNFTSRKFLLFTRR
jgi:putative flippase GtrA